VSQDLQKMTIDVLATCIFGNDFDTLNGNTSRPLASYNYCFECFNNPMHFIPNYEKLPLPANIRWRKEMEIFDAYIWSIIAQAKKSMEDNNSSKENNIKSLIELMIEGGMADKDIRCNVGTFFLAGHETTTSILLWIVGLIAKYPEVQEKARKEVLENTKNGFTYETLKDLNYIDWIIREAMRLYPPVSVTEYILFRRTETETIIGNYYIPAKTRIQVDFVSMLHSKEIWGDPQNFRPERFDPDILTKEQRSSWMPFSNGPRICIGMNFSLTQQKIFLATLLREFSLIKLSENSVLELMGGIALSRPKHYQVQFKACEKEK